MKPKRVTSQMVAERARVSRTTVSFVLNHIEGVQISQETRLRVLKAARELGYIPNSNPQDLSGKRTKIVSLILSRSPDRIGADITLNPLLEGLVEIARRQPVRLVLNAVEGAHPRQAYLELAWLQRIDGMLILGPRLDDEALHALEEDGFPAVLLGQLPGSALPSVAVNVAAAAGKAVWHLIRLGRQRIACITGAPPQYAAAQGQLKGYREALAAAGISPNDHRIRYGDFTFESGYRQMQNLLASRERCDAAFVASDGVALGAMRAIREAGLSIPADVALVGCGDAPLARYTEPPLTTVRLPVEELTRTAAEMLLALLDGRTPEQTHPILDTELIVRKSCGG